MTDMGGYDPDEQGDLYPDAIRDATDQSLIEGRRVPVTYPRPVGMRGEGALEADTHIPMMVEAPLEGPAEAPKPRGMWHGRVRVMPMPARYLTTHPNVISVVITNADGSQVVLAKQ